MKFRWGIIGTGNIARQFAEGLAVSPFCEIRAVASRDSSRAAAFALAHRIPTTHGDYSAILADSSVDAIYLSLPNAMHHQWTIRALRAGKHVLCEKPLACSPAEAQEMFDVARINGRVLIEAFMYRAHPQTRRIVELIGADRIGSLKLIRTSFCFRVRNWQGNIRFDPALAGGALMDVGCYCVNFSRLIAGCAPSKVLAVARMHESGVDEQTSVVMQFPTGVTAEFTCGMMTQVDNSAYIAGDEGYLVAGWPWKPGPPATTIELRRSIPPRQDSPAAKPVVPAPELISVANDRPLYGIEADAFVACVVDGAAPFVSAEESIQNAIVIDSIRKQIYA